MAKTAETTGTDEVRKQLIAQLRGGQAHATFDEVIEDFPAEHRGTVLKGLPYSALSRTARS